MAPDGNGGIYQALVTSGVREDMRARGVEHIHAYCVDNCLVRVADPVFIGFASSLNVDIATKVVRKRNATESVGLILQKNGKPDVVEYSEIDKETAEARDPKHPDVLKFRAANIVNHYYSFRFLETIENWSHKLPHHVARKKIPCVDPQTGEALKPEKPNGIKLEQFVFDVFPMTPLDKFASIEVRREDEFSPLKNARGTGLDDADTSKRDVMQQGQRWVEQAGGVVVTEGDATGIEVSPLISYVCFLSWFPTSTLTHAGRRGSHVSARARDEGAGSGREGGLTNVRVTSDLRLHVVGSSSLAIIYIDPCFEPLPPSCPIFQASLVTQSGTPGSLVSTVKIFSRRRLNSTGLFFPCYLDFTSSPLISYPLSRSWSRWDWCAVRVRSVWFVRFSRLFLFVSPLFFCLEVGCRIFSCRCHCSKVLN